MQWRYALVAIAVAIAPLISPNQFYLVLASDIAVLAIAAIGLNILIGASGQFSIGQAGFYAVGAYASAILAARHGVALPLSILGGIAAGIIVGGLMSLVALRTRTYHLAMATLAFGFVVEILAQRWISFTGGPMGLSGIPSLNFGDARSGPVHFFWVACGLWLIAQMLGDHVLKSEWGLRLRAIKQNEAFASTVGLNVPMWRAGVFILAAALAALSGALFAHQTGYISSDAFGLERSIQLLTAVVVGGLGHPYAAILGATFIVVMNQATASLYEVSRFIFGAIFLVVMLGFPGGISGVLRLIADRVGLLRPTKAGAEINGALALSPVQAMPGSASVVLKLEGVSKSYGGVKAVSDVELSVRSGTIHALIGPNGAGKSTLINLVNGLYAPSSGRIAFLDRDVTAAPAHLRARAGMARTFQNLQLVSGLSVLDNVVLGLARQASAATGFLDWLLRGQLALAQQRRGLAILRFLGIERLASAIVDDLPYGHRKLVEMARALAQQPRLMLLDEPIAGLNEEESKEVAKAVSLMKAHGMTIVIVEHHMPFVMGISDTVTVLNHGRVIASGTPSEIQTNPAVIEAYLGTSVEAAVTPAAPESLPC